MSTVRNIWSEARTDLKKDKVTPLDILQEQANAINKDADKTNLISMVMSFSIGKEGLVDKIKHVLYLFPKNGSDYNYRFIEIVSEPDSDYPLKVYAYQSGNIHFGECKTENEFYEALFKIFNDDRLQIVFEQLRSIGNTIEDWKNEK